MSVQLSYNSKVITIPKTHYRFLSDDSGTSLINRSASGLVETLNVSPSAMISIGWQNFICDNATHITLKRNLAQWFQFAREGGDWTLALDSSEVANTATAVASTSTATLLTLASTSGINTNGQYVLRSKAHMDLVKVTSVTATQVGLAESVNYAYAAGSRFRAQMFWPGKLTSIKNPIIEMPPVWWSFEIDFTEDVNAI